jgi:hypothetical protein
MAARIKLEVLEELQRWALPPNRWRPEPFYRARWRALLSCEGRTLEIPSYEGPLGDGVGPSVEDLIGAVLLDASSYRSALDVAANELLGESDELAVFGAFVDELGGFADSRGALDSGERYAELAASYRGCKREYEQLGELLGVELRERALDIGDDEQAAAALAAGRPLDEVPA